MPDVEIPTNGQILFASGRETGARNCINVTIINDDILETNEQGTFQLNPIGNSTAVVTILSDDVLVTIIDDDSEHNLVYLYSVPYLVLRYVLTDVALLELLVRAHTEQNSGKAFPLKLAMFGSNLLPPPSIFSI